MLAVIRYQQEKLEIASSLLRTIEEESEYYENALFLLVRIFLAQKIPKKAIALIRQTINNESITIRPALYTLLASLYMEQNQIEKGYKILDDALKKYPENAQIHFEYGLLLEQDSQQQQAVARMKKTLLFDPDHDEALNYLGYIWADNNVNLDKALEYIQKSLRLKPNNGYIQDSLGWVYYRMGKYDLAIREILAALKLEPDDPNIYEHLGDIYTKQGKKFKAKDAYKKAKQRFKTETGKLAIQKKIDGIE